MDPAHVGAREKIDHWEEKLTDECKIIIGIQEDGRGKACACIQILTDRCNKEFETTWPNHCSIFRPGFVF